MGYAGPGDPHIFPTSFKSNPHGLSEDTSHELAEKKVDIIEVRG